METVPTCAKTAMTQFDFDAIIPFILGGLGTLFVLWIVGISA